MFSQLAPENNRINFFVFDNLPYLARITITVVLLLLGLTIQVLFDLYWGGLFILFAVALNLVRGFHSTTKTPLNGKWETVTLKEIKRILELEEKNSAWDKSYIDISCGRGFFSLVFILLLWGALEFFIFPFLPFHYFLIARYDYLILLVPFWLTGLKTIYQNSDLIIKARTLERLCRTLQDREDILVEPSLKIGAHSKTAGKVPTDCRAMLKFLDGPSELMGLQIQISINRVQSTAYPYVYCVILAKKGFNLKSYYNIQLPPNIICEFPKNDEVEVIVIRQYTTKRSGYHTSSDAAASILSTALATVKEIKRIYNLQNVGPPLPE